MRLIDADALEELFREVIGGIAKRPEINGNLEHMIRASAMVVEMIKDAPTIEPEPHWIPCSERLPEKSGRYLVTNTRLGAFEVTWNIFYNGKGEAQEGWLYEDGTIAWMPLPEPYREEGGE